MLAVGAWVQLEARGLSQYINGVDTAACVGDVATRLWSWPTAELLYYLPLNARRLMPDAGAGPEMHQGTCRWVLPER